VMDSFSNPGDPLTSLNLPPVILDPALGSTLDGPSIGSGMVTLENNAINTYSVKTGFVPTVQVTPAAGPQKFRYDLTLSNGQTWSTAQLTSNILAGFPGITFTKQVCSGGFGIAPCLITPPIADTGTSVILDLTGFGSQIFVIDEFTSSSPTARASDFTNTFTTVPGPLPVLGVGAAFGFSRKLRNRIKASA
ncbi:MAG: hypothetical protein VKL58_07770, partial [Cyanobacteriota bacterium]|nr:hypothetical protein [Cyanobacteriota bacterium]